MRFGAFIAPFHAQRHQNPTLALQRDVDLSRHLEALGFDEVWFGEHHSSGAETIASPEIFCAHVAAKTERINVGTGVISLPYHNPLWVADRVTLLDHLTRGRLMLGIGPGVLQSDAQMIGLQASDLRGYLEEDLPVLLHLLRSEEPLSVRTDRYELHDAHVQLGLYNPDIEIALTSMFSPAGPVLAGKHGLGILQLSGLAKDALAILPDHLASMEQTAADHGHQFDRSGFRVVGMMHLAATKDEAIADVAYGLDDYFDYAQQVIGGNAASGLNFAQRLEWVLESGTAVVGTADEAIAVLENLIEVSGGVGAFLLWGHEWASPEATRRSYEIFARRVIPALTGTSRRIEQSRDSAAAGIAARRAKAAAPASVQ